MRSEDRDILFGDRFGAWTPGDGLDRDPVDVLIDAYFDGDISDDDRIRLFELLRRDPDRCLRFVEMQRTAILLEQRIEAPDLAEPILARLDALAGAAGAARSRRLRIGPAAGRLAIAAAVAIAGAGLVIVGQSGPPRGIGPAAPAPGAMAEAAPARPVAEALPQAAMAPAPPEGEAALPRIALDPGRLHSTRSGLFTDPGQPEIAINGLGSSAIGAPPADPAFTAAPGRSDEMRRFIGFAYSGQPWRYLGVWPAPPPADAESAAPASGPHKAE